MKKTFIDTNSLLGNKFHVAISIFQHAAAQTLLTQMVVPIRGHQHLIQSVHLFYVLVQCGLNFSGAVHLGSQLEHSLGILQQLQSLHNVGMFAAIRAFDHEFVDFTRNQQHVGANLPAIALETQHSVVHFREERPILGTSATVAAETVLVQEGCATFLTWRLRKQWTVVLTDH